MKRNINALKSKVIVFGRENELNYGKHKIIYGFGMDMIEEIIVCKAESYKEQILLKIIRFNYFFASNPMYLISFHYYCNGMMPTPGGNGYLL